jgi:uncharacterized protein YjdB
MATYQVAWNATTKAATVQANGDALPGGSTKVGTFVYTPTSGVYGATTPQVLYHYVRDVLYAVDVEDMQSLTIAEDTAYVALSSIVIAPGTVSIAVAATQQLTITPTPADASNTAVAWTTSDATKATVSASGLVTGVAAGSATITATSVDGAKVATRTVTVTA